MKTPFLILIFISCFFSNAFSSEKFDLNDYLDKEIKYAEKNLYYIVKYDSWDYHYFFGRRDTLLEIKNLINGNYPENHVN